MRIHCSYNGWEGRGGEGREGGREGKGKGERREGGREGGEKGGRVGREGWEIYTCTCMLKKCQGEGIRG